MSQAAATIAVPTSPGPVGTPRDPRKTIKLIFLTLSIYQVIWTYQTYEELKLRRGEGLGGIVGVLLGGFAPWILAGEVEKLYQEDHLPSPVNMSTGFLMLVPIWGLIQWYTRVQGALNAYWVSHGALAV